MLKACVKDANGSVGIAKTTFEVETAGHPK